MAGEMPGMTLKPIGTVRSPVKQPPGPNYDWQSVISEIEIDSSLTEALDGLEGFSHIIVLWWMHRTTSEKAPMKVHPKRKKELPLVGVFASRSPHRPNSLGLATVKLLERQGNVLRVKGLDAIDGSPVIDIKPHIPGSDSPPDARVPEWIPK